MWEKKTVYLTVLHKCIFSKLLGTSDTSIVSSIT